MRTGQEESQSYSTNQLRPLLNTAYAMPAPFGNVFGLKEAAGKLMPSLGSNRVLGQGGKTHGFSFSRYNKRGGS